jgi:hypothetical protein
MSRGKEGLIEIAIVVALFASVVAIVSPYVHQELPTLRAVDGRGWSPDEGTVLHNADRLRQGDVLYADYFDFKGPVGFLPFTLAFAFDRPSIAAGRTAMFFVLGLLAAVTYLAVRRSSERRWVGIAFAGWVPFVAWQCWPYAYQDLLGSTFVIGAVALLDERDRRLTLAAAGGLLAFALWTTISHGAPALVAIAVAVGLRAWIGGTLRDAGRALGWLLAGAAAGSAPIWIWFALQGALDNLLWANFVFPFRHYMAPINEVAYGFDAGGYVEAWQGENALDGVLAQLVGGAAVWLPRLALVSSGLTAIALIGLAAKRARDRRPLDGETASLLRRMAVPAALGAVALPVVAGLTRADLAHIGLVIPESAVALSALVIPLGASIRGAGIVHAGQRALAGATLVAALCGGWFHVRQVLSPYPEDDPDREAREALELDRLERWTRPGDAIVSPIYGGYTFLLSRRKNASRFATLWEDYAPYQWKVTADDIVARRPKVLRANAKHVKRLSKLRPEIARMYLGMGEIYVRRDLVRFRR